MNKLYQKLDIEGAVRTILLAMGENPDRPDLKDTPKRFAKAMLSFSPNKKAPVITTFKATSDGLVIINNLEVRSLCGHHLFPFIGTASVAYFPDKKKAGLSKFQRALDYIANRPQDQEALTKQLLDFLVKHIQPKGMMIKITAEHTCYSDDTEILTDKGFQLFSEYKSGKVATMNLQSGLIEYQLPINRIEKEYSGEMINFKSSNQLVTPDHRVIYKTDWDVRMNNGYKEMRAENFDSSGYILRIPKAGICRDFSHKPKFKKRKYDERLFAELLGVYLAEGSCTIRNDNGNTICRISQNRKGKAFDRIQALLTDLHIPYKIHKSSRENVNFTILDVELVKYFATLGKSHDKFIPNQYKYTSFENRMALLDGFFMGDGCYIKNNKFYTTKSERLASDIQEILTVSGIGSNMRKRTNANCYDVMECMTKVGEKKDYVNEYIGRGHITKKQYSGKVYCLSVPNATLVVRRNGKVFISGNCMTVRGVTCHDAQTTTMETYGICDETEILSVILPLIK